MLRQNIGNNKHQTIKFMGTECGHENEGKTKITDFFFSLYN